MKCIPPFAVATLLSFSALAQHTNSLESAPRLNDPEALSMTGWDAAVNASFVGSGTTKFQGAHLADSSAYSLNLGVGRQWT